MVALMEIVGSRLFLLEKRRKMEVIDSRKTGSRWKHLIEFAAACRIFKDLGARPSNWDLKSCCKARFKNQGSQGHNFQVGCST